MQCLEWNPEIPSWDNYYLNLPKGPRLGTNPISWDITPRRILNVLPAITSTRTTFSFCSSSLLIAKGSSGSSCQALTYGWDILHQLLIPTTEWERDSFQRPSFRWVSKKKIQIPSRDDPLNSPEKRRINFSCSYHHISAPCPRDGSLKERSSMIHLVIKLMMLWWALTEILLYVQEEGG